MSCVIPYVCPLVCMFWIYIDGAIFHQSWEDRVKLMSECITVATQSGFPVYCTRLEEVTNSRDVQYWV